MQALMLSLKMFAMLGEMKIMQHDSMMTCGSGPCRHPSAPLSNPASGLEMTAIQRAVGPRLFGPRREMAVGSINR